jgi:hypothetical protein
MDYVEGLLAISPWLAFLGAALWFWVRELRESPRALQDESGSGELVSARELDALPDDLLVDLIMARGRLPERRARELLTSARG